MWTSNKSQDIVDALIIDDEKDICYLLNGILRQRRLSTHYVNTLSDARTALRTEVPEILFLDNHLPDGYGIDFIHHIKEECPSAKVVMITAHDTPQDRQKAYREGVDYFLPKPFTRKQINEAIDQLLPA